ncbi:MAG TPA: prephenate dehydrogenase/arogenate dehydrogenase family protein [Candidatus Baltobacteraceae bacterium]|nr:prephenate dehydrogenase/arogenate dehydrogenase family protein [Candidatus Baltobacteraceae bacterium]
MMTLGIIGTGMIGGSIGIRARELGWRVLGFDANPEAALEARVRGAIEEVAMREEIDERADVIVIAAHIAGTIAEIERLRFTQPRKARLIIDISSVKAPVVEAARGLTNFVATHPMAGRERSGPSAAARDVFEGKTWLYIPTGDRELDWRAVEFIGAFGAIPVEADAIEHDRIVAVTSHLPQVLATLFAARLSRPEVQIDAFMGPTAKELLRLSRSSMEMWRDILNANRENIGVELRALAHDLQEAAAALESERLPVAF